MNASRLQFTRRMAAVPRLIAALTLFCMAFMSAQGCASKRTEAQAFATPDEAVQALTSALGAEGNATLLAIVGSDGEPIITSGDAVDDRQNREKFLASYREKHILVDDGPDSKTLVIGNDEWPFPVPIVRSEGKWYFDSLAGQEELLNRRIGRNELSAIQVCKAIADAQREYAHRDPTGGGLHEYAQKFASDPGKRNGLYWPTVEGEAPSPLGELVAAAQAEGYRRNKEGPTPYHGYYYRILAAQGPGAPGGALDYVVKGRMILGFAVVAYPAEYDNSGIMTFIMGHDGVVYQKDLGKRTAKTAGGMKAFNPSDGWKKAE